MAKVLARSPSGKIVMVSTGEVGALVGNYIWTADGGTSFILADNDSPLFGHTWMDDSGIYRVYSRTALVDGSTVAAPCYVDMAVDPITAAGVGYSAYNDFFNNNDYDTCRNTKIEGNSATVTETNNVLEMRYSGNTNYSYGDTTTRAPIGAVDFSCKLTYENLYLPQRDGPSFPADYSYGDLAISTIIGGVTYVLGPHADTIFSGMSHYDSVSEVFTDLGSMLASASLELVRSGTDLIAKIDDVTVKTWAGVSTASPTVLRVYFAGRTHASDGTATADITGIALTGG